ncbi:hypothetical protein FKM82_012161 [Ascaphus truei]
MALPAAFWFPGATNQLPATFQHPLSPYGMKLHPIHAGTRPISAATSYLLTVPLHYLLYGQQNLCHAPLFFLHASGAKPLAPSPKFLPPTAKATPVPPEELISLWLWDLHA